MKKVSTKDIAVLCLEIADIRKNPIQNICKYSSRYPYISKASVENTASDCIKETVIAEAMTVFQLLRELESQTAGCR